MIVDHPVQTGICERLNADSRPYKVLMNVAGDSADFAITPHQLKASAKQISGMLTPAEASPDYVIGFAPGGIAIAVAVALELNLPAVIAYKTRLALPHELTWIEPHCFTNTFYLYGITVGMSVLLIDDEVDSGNTLVNAANALTKVGAKVCGVASAVEVTHDGSSFGRERLQAIGLELRALRRVESGTPQP